MSRILAIDPGATTGWVVWDDAQGSILKSGQFRGSEGSLGLISMADSAVIEMPVGYGPTRPEMVACGIVAGQLHQQCVMAFGPDRVHWRTRLQVCKALEAMTHGVVRVRNDATAWAAVKILNGGDGCDKKGGPLYGIKAHERAALALVMAYCHDPYLQNIKP